MRKKAGLVVDPKGRPFSRLGMTLEPMLYIGMSPIGSVSLGMDTRASHTPLGAEFDYIGMGRIGVV